MRQPYSLLAAALTCIWLHVTNVPAAADTITFDSIRDGFYSTFVTQGVIFSLIGSSSINVISGEVNCNLCASNGTQYLSASGTPPHGIQMTPVSGQPFSLLGFDAAESFAVLPERWAQQVNVIGVLASGGTVAASFALDQVLDGTGGVDDFQRFAMPVGFSGLTTVSFFGGGSNPPIEGNLYRDFAIDNIVTDLPPPVPEPGTFALVLAGLIATSRALRRDASKLLKGTSMFK